MSEASRVPGTNIENEVPPNQGINISSLDAKDLKDGDTIYLMVKKPNKISAVEQSFKISKGEAGKFVLSPLEVDVTDVQRRKELAKAIVQSHSAEIMEQALVATEEALARKPAEKLEKMQAKGKAGARAKVSTKKGCMFLDIGGEETVL